MYVRLVEKFVTAFSNCDSSLSVVRHDDAESTRETQQDRAKKKSRVFILDWVDLKLLYLWYIVSNGLFQPRSKRELNYLATVAHLFCLNRGGLVRCHWCACMYHTITTTFTLLELFAPPLTISTVRDTCLKIFVSNFLIRSSIGFVNIFVIDGAKHFCTDVNES